MAVLHDATEDTTFSVDSIVREHHIYKHIWSSVVDEELFYQILLSLYRTDNFHKVSFAIIISFIRLRLHVHFLYHFCMNNLALLAASIHDIGISVASGPFNLFMLLRIKKCHLKIYKNLFLKISKMLCNFVNKVIRKLPIIWYSIALRYNLTACVFQKFSEDMPPDPPSIN